MRFSTGKCPSVAPRVPIILAVGVSQWRLGILGIPGIPEIPDGLVCVVCVCVVCVCVCVRTRVVIVRFRHSIVNSN